MAVTAVTACLPQGCDECDSSFAASSVTNVTVCPQKCLAHHSGTRDVTEFLRARTL